MKFLCNHCKAKYQISDDRVAGRTLRMKCRKCGHDIIIKGAFSPSGPPHTSSSSQNLPALASPVTGAKASPQPFHAVHAGRPDIEQSASGSALGRSFEKSMAASPSLGAENLPLDEQWHAALNNKPAGPFSLEQIKEFVEQGRLEPESLVWREGFSDWTAVEKVSELKEVVKPKMSSWPSSGPAVSGSSSASRKLPGGSSAPRSTFEIAAQAARAEQKPVTEQDIGFDSTVIDDSGLSLELKIGEPAADPDAAPLGVSIPSSTVSEPTATAKIGTEAESDTETDRPSFAALAKGLAAKGADSIRPGVEAVSKGIQSMRAESKKGKAPSLYGLAIIAVLVAAAAFGVTLGVVFASRWFKDDTGTAQAATQELPQKPQEPEIKIAEIDPELIEPVEETEESVEEQEHKASPRNKEKKDDNKRSSSSSTKDEKTEKTLSDTDQKLLARFSQKEGSSPKDISATTKEAPTTKKPLSSSQVRAVVSKNRTALQRCYEIAARSTGSSQTVRIDVRLTVAPSGGVSQATVKGPTVGNLKNCILSSVRRWVFPSSSQSTEVPFPLVFQPGA